MGVAFFAEAGRVWWVYGVEFSVCAGAAEGRAANLRRAGEGRVKCGCAGAAEGRVANLLRRVFYYFTLEAISRQTAPRFVIISRACSRIAGRKNSKTTADITQNAPVEKITHDHGATFAA